MARFLLESLERKNMTYYLSDYLNDWDIYYFKKEDDKYVLELDLPGFKKDEVSISVENKNSSNYLHVQGQNKRRSYQKKFSISEKFDLQTVKASLVDGVLKIAIKLREEEESRKKILIE